MRVLLFMVVQAGELISNDGLKRALRHAKARFHPDKVRAAQQAAATAAQAAGGSGKARKGGVNGCGLTKTALEEVVRAEELSKILNSWDVRNL